MTCVAARLLDLGADAAARFKGSRNGALHVAAIHGHLEMMRVLLAAAAASGASGAERSSAGAVVPPPAAAAAADAVNKNQDTPLMFACSMGHAGAAGLLLNVRRWACGERGGWATQSAYGTAVQMLQKREILKFLAADLRPAYG